MTGTVKPFHSTRTFFFVAGKDGREYFVHRDDVADDFDVRPGDLVTFAPEYPEPSRGPRARGIRFAGVAPLGDGDDPRPPRARMAQADGSSEDVDPTPGVKKVMSTPQARMASFTETRPGFCIFRAPRFEGGG